MGQETSSIGNMINRIPAIVAILVVKTARHCPAASIGSNGCLVVLWVADRLICTVGAVYGATELDSVRPVPSYRCD